MNKYSMSNKLKVLIITCWGVYIACLIIKLCGGNRFEIATTNQRFIDVCNYIDNTLLLKVLISCIFYVFNTYIVYLCLTKQRFFNDWWLIPIFIVCGIVNILIDNVYVNFIISSITIIIFPLIRTKGRAWLHIIVGNILIFLFQLISLLTRNIGWHLENDSMLVMLITQIDYYIMLVIYYLYVNRKEIK